MIEPEFKDEQFLPLIKKFEDIDDSVYKDTEKTSFNDTKQDDDDYDDEMPTRRPISDTRDRLKADMIESLYRHMG